MADRTLADLYKTKDITEDQLEEAVAAYLKKPAEGVQAVGDLKIDIAEAVKAHPYAEGIMANAEAPEGQRRNAVRTASCWRR